MLELRGTGQEIAARLAGQWPEARAAVTRARALIAKGQLLEWQAMLLFGLAREVNGPGARILEIGTLVGFSAMVMALAAPMARIWTLNPAQAEAARARANLRARANVTVVAQASWTYLQSDTQSYDFIFVDGDHKRVRLDLPWFERLRVGGLMLFHDYSPAACPPVFETVAELGARHGVAVLAMDEQGVGMAGVRRGNLTPRPPSPNSILEGKGEPQ